MIDFFFSSRRRHTRFDCDWSSDVCSSDLIKIPDVPLRRTSRVHERNAARGLSCSVSKVGLGPHAQLSEESAVLKSRERRSQIRGQKQDSVPSQDRGSEDYSIPGSPSGTFSRVM